MTPNILVNYIIQYKQREPTVVWQRQGQCGPKCYCWIWRLRCWYDIGPPITLMTNPFITSDNTFSQISHYSILIQPYKRKKKSFYSLHFLALKGWTVPFSYIRWSSEGDLSCDGGRILFSVTWVSDGAELLQQRPGRRPACWRSPARSISPCTAHPQSE